jgi:hypothetical protein
MNQVIKGKQCSHPQCQCMVPGTTPYCSDSCRTAASDDPCRCGHDECMHASHARPDQPDHRPAR